MASRPVLSRLGFLRQGSFFGFHVLNRDSSIVSMLIHPKGLFTDKIGNYSLAYQNQGGQRESDVTSSWTKLGNDALKSARSLVNKSVIDPNCFSVISLSVGLRWWCNRIFVVTAFARQR